MILRHPGRTGVALVTAFVLWPGELPARSGHDSGTDIESWSDLPRASAVRDPVFAILLGLLESDGYGTLTRDSLERELKRFGGRTRVPYTKVESIVRKRPEAGQGPEVLLLFGTALRVRVPYSILGYHPGRIEASASCRMRERSLGALRVKSEALEDVRLFSMEDGRLDIDIDGWFDRIAGASLDDMRINHLAVVRYRGRLIGLGIGLNPRGLNRCGAFDFAADKVLFPLPPVLVAACKALRSQPRPG